MEYAKESVLVKVSDVERSQKLEAVQVAKEAWRARFPEQPEEGSDWLIGLFQQDELIKLLATIGALTLNALPNVGRRSNAGAIASAVGLDMRTGGGPSPGVRLSHVPKAHVVQTRKEAGPDRAGAGLEAMKQVALVIAAASRLAGTRWLPDAMRRSRG